MQRIIEVLAKQTSRRSLLTRAATMAAAVAAGLATIPERLAEAAGCCTHCPNYSTIRNVGCCQLGFPTNCSDMSCFDNNHTWWMWTCVSGDYTYNCYECCDFNCSKATRQLTPTRSLA